MKKKILLFLKLPPPLTGATLINQYVCESNYLARQFNLQLIPISYKSQIEDVRVLSLRKIGTIIKLYIRLIKSLVKYKPQVVYFQISPVGMAFYRDCTYIFLLKLFRKHIVYHMHGKGIRDTISTSRIKKSLYKWAFDNSSVICLAECLTTDISEVYNGVPYVVNNAISLVTSRVIPEQKERNEIFRVLFLSNLIVSKGIFVFLDALQLIKKKGIEVEAYIVGKEAEINNEKLIHEINRRNLGGCVKYLGPKYNDEKTEIFKGSDVLIYPTYNDVWGLVILEAMQFGLPVIASREGAIPEIIDDGITGFLVEKNNPEQIVDKLVVLLQNPELRKQMGEAGRTKFLKKYTLDIFEQNMKKVFDEILSEQ